MKRARQKRPTKSPKGLIPTHTEMQIASELWLDNFRTAFEILLEHTASPSERAKLPGECANLADSIQTEFEKRWPGVKLRDVPV